MHRMVEAQDKLGLRDILQRMGYREEDIFDTSHPDDDIYGDILAEGLTEEEKEFADKIKRYLRGVMLVTGDPGSGKGIWGNFLPWMIKTFFTGRKALLDYKPRPSYGLYLPFNEVFVREELGKMTQQAEIPKSIARNDTKAMQRMQDMAAGWVESERGQVYLSNSVLVLEELKRYFHNRRPMNPMGITIGHILTWWRHLDTLILGMTPFEREIDAISFLPYVTLHVVCEWTDRSTTIANVYQTHWVGSRGVLNIRGKPDRIEVDPFAEREMLGGKRIVDIYNSKFLPSMKPVGGRIKM